MFVVVATTDIIFAVDSIPAIFAVTQEPFIVFAANAFAMIGLRALYFLLVGLMDRFVYLSQGLAVDPRVHRREDAADRHLARADLAVAGGDRRRRWWSPRCCRCEAEREGEDARGVRAAADLHVLVRARLPGATWKRSAARFITTDATVTICSAHGSSSR